MNKTILITGANTGIGKETARALAKEGTKLILACRSVAKGETARQEIMSESGNHDIAVMGLDLASFKSIRKFAADVISKYDRLDVLINNAGLSVQERQTTEEGHEMDFGVNHLGHFLLTNLLLDLLKHSAPSRIVNLASSMHKRASFSMKDPQLEKNWDSLNAYASSKLLNILTTFEMADKLEGTKVTVNCLNPGLVRSDFFRSYTGPYKMPFILKLLLKLIGKSPEEAADTPVYLALSPEVEGISGRYFENRKIIEASSAARDKALARAVWDYSSKLTGI